MSSSAQWAARIQKVIRAAEADGYEVLIGDEQADTRIEIRLCAAADPEDDGTLILEWNA
ncbi:hypothetical protein [Streptomyces cupreus]|uniref:Uncharacterized protein n=1 Tax=Streptomyces cupreus TaxID=2759956 RepID=A0A7X1J4K7_9ACTN|nr:hypothetical protein [Streptomyces cupreus]MBC2904006.1 hypothetical protein [Streptomyces cupreus]